MASKTCAICGKPSGMYPLCRDCFKLRDEGKIEQCPDCKKWHLIDTPCDCKEENLNNICYICGEKSNSKEICPNCYKLIIDLQKELMDGFNVSELETYYYNIINSLWKYSSLERMKTQLLRLIAIANVANIKYKYTALQYKVKEDIIKSINKKKEQIERYKNRENENKNESKTLPNNKEETAKQYLKTTDGHMVASPGERVIDDILYELRIVHCYSMEVPFETIISNKYCDWFIPTIGASGIYIEYWGYDDDIVYLKNKEEKTKLYEENNLAFIGIEKDEPIKGVGLRQRLIKQLNDLAKKQGIEKFIKL